MPYNGAGVFSPLNPPNFPAVSGQVISAAYFNAVINDLIAGLTQAVAKDGQSTISGLTMLDLLVTGSATLPAGTTLGGKVPIFSRYTTGEVVSSIDPVAPVGTLLLDGKTIGSGASGATGRANADTQALFELIWNQSSNTLLPIQDASGAATARGVSASADFSANKRLPLPSPPDGASLVAAVTSDVMTLTNGAVISHTHTGTAEAAGDHTHLLDTQGVSNGSTSNYALGGAQYYSPTTATTRSSGSHTHNLDIAATGVSANKAHGVYLKFYIAL